MMNSVFNYNAKEETSLQTAVYQTTRGQVFTKYTTRGVEKLNSVGVNVVQHADNVLH